MTAAELVPIPVETPPKLLLDTNVFRDLADGKLATHEERLIEIAKHRSRHCSGRARSSWRRSPGHVRPEETGRFEHFRDSLVWMDRLCSNAGMAEDLPWVLLRAVFARGVGKRSILDNHLIKACGSKRLDEINVQDVEDLKAKLLRTTSGKYVNNVLNVFRKMLRYAADLELVARVPAMKPLRLPPSKYEFLAFDDFAKLVEAARQEPELYAAVLLAGEAGLRLGEIVGLHWSDIDRAGVLTVTYNDWRGHLGSPKSGRAREVPLTRRTLEAVKAVRHLRSKRVFCQCDGAPWTVTMMRTGLLRQEKRAGSQGGGSGTGYGTRSVATWRCAERRRSRSKSWPDINRSRPRTVTCIWRRSDGGRRWRCSKRGVVRAWREAAELEPNCLKIWGE